MLFRSDAEAWTAVLTSALEATQDRLAAAAIARDPRAFTQVAAGKTGVGGIYDVVRRLGAALRGESFDASHGGDEST